MSKFLGIDTSNYTTSVAIFDSQDMSIMQNKMLLPVKSGERGIRQSEAVFHHTKQLPDVMTELFNGNVYDFKGIGVSVKPRLVDNSYMPCFLVGELTATTTGLVDGIVPDKTSHQVGHIIAALYSCGKLDLLHSDKPFIAFHVSGGTTDVLLCSKDNENVLKIEEIGGSSDLKAGQVIDRIGVKLGLKFPCGKELEDLAMQSNVEYKIKPSTKGLFCSLSGIENQCDKLIRDGKSASGVAKFCLSSVFETLIKITKLVVDQYGDLPIVYAGGVMSNKMFRKNISEICNSYFAQPEFSCDNAAGVAIYSAVRKGLI